MDKICTAAFGAPPPLPVLPLYIDIHDPGVSKATNPDHNEGKSPFLPKALEFDDDVGRKLHHL